MTHDGERKCDRAPGGSHITDPERREARAGLTEKDNQGLGFEVHPMSNSSNNGTLLLSVCCGLPTSTHADYW